MSFAYTRDSRPAGRYSKVWRSRKVGPAAISGLIVFSDVTQMTGLVDNDKVSSLTDYSGNGNHGTASGAQRPTYKTGVTAGGLPSILYNGTSEWFTLPNMSTGLTEATFFLLVRRAVDPPVTTTKTGLWDMGSAATADTVAPWTDGIIYEATGTNARKTTVNPVTSLASAFRTYVIRSKASYWDLRLEGASIFNTGSNTFATTSSPKLGKARDSIWFDGHITMFGIYNRSLTDAETATLEAYLSLFK